MNRQICLEQLREKLFFTKSEKIFVQDEDDSNIEHEYNIYPIGTRFNIYKKKKLHILIFLDFKIFIQMMDIYLLNFFIIMVLKKVFIKFIVNIVIK